ncbi:hypothetical protein TNCT_417501 [Trichonephila clavata]|uniref:Uncharacterized protein n=1 Tax=Trichonephila clavata TaxID=2740835 RepID=A0A8X6I5A8_TRICU|nr:hypothetical protein TNCT_417501 [Trichonephila clavata]
MYLEDFPNRRQTMLFKQLYRRLSEAGILQVIILVDDTLHTTIVDEAVLREFEPNLLTSLQVTKRVLGVHCPTAMRILHKNMLQPYHVQRVPALCVSITFNGVHSCIHTWAFAQNGRTACLCTTFQL